MLLVHWATYYINMLSQWLAPLILGHQTALLSCPGFILLSPLPKMVRSILSGSKWICQGPIIFLTQFLVTLGENENEDFWEWKEKVWSDQAYWTIKDFTFGGWPVNFCGKKFPFKPNMFHLCFVNFIWCMLQQTKNIVYLCLKSVQMFGKERESPCIQQLCFCQSGALNGRIFGE